MKKNINLSITFIVVLILAGCTTPEFNVEFKPQPKIAQISKPPADSLYILTPKEGRKSGGHSLFGMESLIALPLVPYVHEQITPESMVFTKSGFKYDFKNDLADWLVKDIQASGIFKNVYKKSSSYNTKERLPQGTWILKTTLTKGVWDRYVTAYGLSYACVVLWPLGLPLSYGNVTLELKVTLVNGHTGKPVASKLIFHKTACVEWIYDQVPGAPSIFQRELLDLLKPTTQQLRLFLFENVISRGDKEKL